MWRQAYVFQYVHWLLLLLAIMADICLYCSNAAPRVESRWATIVADETSTSKLLVRLCCLCWPDKITVLVLCHARLLFHQRFEP